MFIKRCFQREPIISTVVTAGTVNILLGMAEGQALLAFLGVLVVSGTLAGRGWHKYRYPLDLPDQSVIFSHASEPLALTESSSVVLTQSGESDTAIVPPTESTHAYWQTTDVQQSALEQDPMQRTERY
ncbi:hypothetical protein [Leptolyngbya iicbica]|uniref:Uncharacterized protein n=2 Tax=Cyanophyceae TaxID=3028117 RepID=A0A4Q7E8G5_9CYAN|nr:hypothetical protein [Leptolyngbya sp. LK]RZM78639.1 hypothetical protein DYY88_07490 [Leptolyngbya sp. LK]